MRLYVFAGLAANPGRSREGVEGNADSSSCPPPGCSTDHVGELKVGSQRL